jgi:purine-binding chemotaxis protein CheW
MSDEVLAAEPSLRFRVGEREYLIPLQAVAEVTPGARPRLIPTVPLALGGVINVRGETVPVLDGATVLQAPPSEGYRHALLLSGDGHRLGLLVSSVSRIERRRPAPPSDAEEPTYGAPFVKRARLREGEVGVIDVPGLVARLQELLRGASMKTGGDACPNAF